MEVETNLDAIRRLGEERVEENLEFRAYLKMRDEDDVDEAVHRILAEVMKGIDCTACGHCCEVMAPAVNREDIKRLARALGMGAAAFRKTHTCKDEFGDVQLRAQPCLFLENKRCKVYPDRPEACRSYPHLHKPDFVGRLLGVCANYDRCPIVFNVYERLKRELWPSRMLRRFRG